jgi:hypothetical protein
VLNCWFSRYSLSLQNFAGPLSRNGIITAEECSTIFRHIQVSECTHVTLSRPLKISAFAQVLLNLSHCLLVHLRSRMEAWDERITLIGDIFLDLVSELTPLIHDNIASETT